MIPFDVFGSESMAADLLHQVRWRDGVECPHCHSDRTVKNRSYDALHDSLSLILDGEPAPLAER